MSDFLVSRLGQTNGAGATDALFLSQWSGEILGAFNNAVVMMDKHQVRTITKGKTASFPAIGKAVASYHTAGVELTGQVLNHANRDITVDDMLIADTFIDNWDEAVLHYDVRSEYNIQMSDALAQAFDQNVLRMALLAARASATVTGGSGGFVSTDADYKTVGADLAAGVYAHAQNYDEKFVPERERNCFVRPAQYYLLAQTTAIINKDWNGDGSYADGKISRIASIPIIKTNNLPITNITTGPSKYQVNASTTAFVTMQKGAVGTVKLMDIALESEKSVRYQGTLSVAKMAVGHGILRPEAAGEGKTS